VYCYAAYTHEFMGITTPEAFHSLVYVKMGAEEETARRLAAVVKKGQRIALGTATDPYQPGDMLANVLFLRSPTKEKFLRWLAADFPASLEAYRRAYADRVYFRGRYRETIDARVRALKHKHGFDDVERDRDFVEAEQIALF